MENHAENGRFILALAQIDSGADIGQNLRKIREFTGEAARRGASLIAFPEYAAYLGEDYAGNAQEISGEIAGFLAECAAEYGMYLHCGSISEKTDRELPRNTSLLFSPAGKLIGKYSKLHLFDIQLKDGVGYRESEEVTAGEKIVLCDTKIGRFGMAICYDMRFGELFRLMAQNGAQVIFVPANFTMNTGKDHWEPLLRARAIENGCYIAAPGQIGKKPGYQAYGKSMIIDPWGNVIARASDREEIILAGIDPGYIGDIRGQVPSLVNIREDVYTLVSERVVICHE